MEGKPLMSDTPMPWDIPGAPHPRDYGLTVTEDNSVEAQRKRNASTRVYVASSWRNIMQEPTVYVLRAAGFEVYDFRNPPESTGFKWSEVGLPNTVTGGEECLIGDYLDGLEHPRSVEGFSADFDAMKNAEVFVLVLPCGRSAHLELGWAVGAGKRTCIYAPEPMILPELMYKMVDHIAADMMDLLGWLGVED